MKGDLYEKSREQMILYLVHSINSKVMINYEINGNNVV